MEVWKDPEPVRRRKVEGKRDLRDRIGKAGCRESSALRVEPQSPEPGSGRGL